MWVGEGKVVAGGEGGWSKRRSSQGGAFIHVGSGSAQTLSAFDFHLEAPAVLARDDREADAAVCWSLGITVICHGLARCALEINSSRKQNSSCRVFVGEETGEYVLAVEGFAS